MTRDTASGNRPFWAATPVRSVRRGHFWVPGERVEHEGKTFQRGPMFAAWEAPAEVTRSDPVVLVHGGGFQGTEWLDTPDGRPGCGQRLVEAGYAIVIVDRPGHGRSALHTDIVEPMGPPFADIPNIGPKSRCRRSPRRWGSSARLGRRSASGSASRTASGDVRGGSKVSGAAVSPHRSVAPASPPVVALLKAGGAAAELLHLPDHGVTGNGHGLTYENNSDAALQPVLAWLERHAGAATMQEDA